MNKLNQILIAVLAVQLAIVGFVYYSQQAASEVSSGPLFENLDATEVVELTMTDTDGNQLKLAEVDGAWVLPDAGDYPADGDKILPIMEKVQDIKTNRLVTQTSDSHKRLQVSADDFNRHLAFKLADGSEYNLYVGSSAGAGATHVRNETDEQVYLTSELTPFEINTSASGWIDSLYFTVPQTAPQTITLENSNGTFELQRTSPTSWTLTSLAADETFDPASATTLLNQISSIRLSAPLGKEAQAEYGLDEPQATVTIVTDDDTYTLMVGAKDPDEGTYILKASTSPYYVSMASFTGDNLVNKTHDEFLQQPPPLPEEGSEFMPQ